MLGLILDNIIVFLYRIIRTGISAYRSRAWPTTTGIVEESRAFADDPYPSTEVYYSYPAGGTPHSGTYIKGFCFGSSAKSFATSFPSKREIVVRYRPDLPIRSFMREDDQLVVSAAHPQHENPKSIA